MKTLLSLFVSILIMAAIFLRIDLTSFGRYLTQADLLLLALAVLFFIPQIAISAYRWQVMIRRNARISFWEAVQLTLAANALNILLPSRAGDLSKGYFAARGRKLQIKRGMNVVFFEKYIDLASLGVVVLTGILGGREWDPPSFLGLFYSLGMIGLFPALYFLKLQTWVSAPCFEKNRLLAKGREFLLDSQAYLNEVKENPRQLAFLILLSIFLWFLHLLQFYVIFLALHSKTSLFHVFRLVPLAIFVGLIPVTMAGVGTRDSALIYLFAPYETASLVVGVGLFASLRYFVPGLLGLPFLNQYLVKEVRSA